jgi:hypothetical protein
MMAKAKDTVTALSPGTDANYRAREDMHTLKQHAEIKADPARHKAAAEMAKAERALLSKIQAPRTTKGVK